MSDVVVVDASLALKWILAELDSSKAVMQLEQWTNEGISVIAPALFTYEVTNALHRQVVAGKLTYEEAKQGLNDLFSIGVLLKFSIYEEISAQAMEFAHQLNLPATYDGHYLALAFHENCEYWTADTRLWNIVKGKLNWVRWFSVSSLAG
jgi:DNA phosphorothioation-dependent restriction protein DptG